MSDFIRRCLADNDGSGGANLEAKCEMNIETNMTLGEEDLVVLSRWSGSRKKKNMVVEDSARYPPNFNVHRCHNIEMQVRLQVKFIY